METTLPQLEVQSNLVLRNCLIRNKLVLTNHFTWPICHLLHKDKEHLTLRNNFRVTKKFLITKFDCTYVLATFDSHTLIKLFLFLGFLIWRSYFVCPNLGLNYLKKLSHLVWPVQMLEMTHPGILVMIKCYFKHNYF